MVARVPAHVLHGAAINFNHPLSRGLAAAFVNFPNQLVDILGKSSAEVVTGGASIVVGERGLAYARDSAGTTGVSAGDLPAFNSDTKEISFYTLWRNTDNLGTVLAQRTDADARFQLAVNPALVYLVGGSGSLTLEGGNNYTSGEWQGVGVSSSDAEVRAYRDGSLTAGSPQNIAAATPASVVIPFAIGNRWSVFPTPQFTNEGSEYAIILCWNRTLTADEQRRIHDDPWQVFEDPLDTYEYHAIAAGLLTTVFNDFDIRYAITEFVSNDFDIRYSITEFVSQDFDIRYAIDEFVFRDFDIRYAINQFVANDFDIRYSIVEFVSQDFDVRYAITEFVFNDFDIRYQIQSAITPVFNDFDIRYAINQFVSNDFDVRYAITEFVSQDFDIRYRINTGQELPPFIDVGVSSLTASFSISSSTPKFTVS